MLDSFSIRPYQHLKDFVSVARIWRETGWCQTSNDEVSLESFYSAGNSFVGTLDDEPECTVHTTPGMIRYQDDDLKMCAITALLTSHIARRRGLGTKVIASTLSKAIEDGAAIAVAGIFEQGFYDRLGFGSGTYEQIIGFDLADLKRIDSWRIPRRLSVEDWEAIDLALKKRWNSHGGCTLLPSSIIRAELGWKSGGFGLGYENDQGELTHFFYGRTENASGPLRIEYFAYQNRDQLRELFALLASLQDQILTASMIEPPHVQLQDMLSSPFRTRELTCNGKHELSHKASAFWQARILNLSRCLEMTHLYGKNLEFNLVLKDPLESIFNEEKIQKSVGGNYIVYLGDDSESKIGHDPNLPTLHASVGSFTRMWLGVRTATELSITDEMKGDQELLNQLDDAFRLPSPKLGWYF